MITKHRRHSIATSLIPQSVREKIYPEIGVKLEDKRPVIHLMAGGGLLKKFNAWMREANPAWKDLV